MEKIASLMVLLAATLWGGSGIFVNILSAAGLSGPQMTAVRLCFVPVFVFLLLLLKNPSQLHVDKKDLGWFFLNGALGTLAFNLCYTYAIQSVGMGTAAVLIYLMPSLVMLFSVLFLHERFTARKGLCLVLSLAGCALVSGIAGGFALNPAGVAAGLFSAVCYAEYNILISTRLKKYGALTNVLYPFAIAAVLNLVYVALFDDLGGIVPIFVRHPSALLVNAGMGLVCSVLTYWLYNTAVKTISASRAAILATFEPAAAMLFGAVLFGEAVTAWGLVGIVCELAALILLSLPEKQLKKQKVEG